VRNETAEGGKSNVDFIDVNFAFDQSVTAGYDIVFRGWGGKGTSLYTVNTSFTNCSFDSRVYESKGYLDGNNKPKYVTWFYDGGKDTNSKVIYEINGGHFISDDAKLSVVRGTAAANIEFKKYNGSYATFSVPTTRPGRTTLRCSPICPKQRRFILRCS